MTLPDLLSPSCALFLDFDGTLVELAPEPGAIDVPSGLVPTLAALHDWLGGAVAVVSGRTIADIDRWLAPLRLAAAGVHGAERRTAIRERIDEPPPDLARVEAAARALAARHPGLLVEHKGRSLALHYRLAPQLEAACIDVLGGAVDATPGLVLLRGKMVVEAKPASASKGAAIAAFLAEPPFNGKRPVFIGDDVTDEAGFEAVQAAGGLGVKVGPGPTVARQRLDGPAALHAALAALLARAGVAVQDGKEARA